MLRSKLQDDLTQALKNQEKTRLDILRMVMSAIKYKEVETKTELSDEEVLPLIKKQVKELNESIDAFTKGDRADLVEGCEAQLEVLLPYLPAELSDEDLKKAVNDVIEAHKEQYEQNPKTIIGICIKELKSKADPARIMKLLNERT